MGPGDVNQFDSILPQCPITFRIDFIPTGYKRQREPGSSQPIVVGKATSRMENLLNKRGLQKENHSLRTPEIR
jgi:hypothetical protein